MIDDLKSANLLRRLGRTMDQSSVELSVRFFVVPLAALMLTGCGRDLRNGHAPGDVEFRDNATVYHLADGVFIHERRDGENHYLLLEDTVAGYRLTPEGLEVEFPGNGKRVVIAERQPENYVTAFITLVPADGVEGTRFAVDPSTIETILEQFNAAMTVEEIYQQKE